MSRATDEATRGVVLLVEDEALLREIATDALIERGFAVLAAASAEEALQHLIVGRAVDVLFTDIHLAGAMDGSTLATMARQLRPQLPVAYTSGNAVPDQIRPVKGSIFVPKPYNPGAIARALKSVIDAAPAAVASCAQAG
jgi:CheY-like chemotaxis protein